MPSILLGLFLLMTFSASAGDVMSSKALDINRDNKVDRIENYKNGELISVARDTKFNGKFDETSYYYPYESPLKPTEVIEKDTDGDGKIDRVEKIYRDPKADLRITTIKVMSKRSPASDVPEKTWVKYSKLSQLKEVSAGECAASFSLDNLAIMKLSGDVSNVRYSLDDGLYKTGWGYNIHQSCLDQWGAESFPNILKKSMEKGLQCLDRLAKENKEKNPNGPNGAYRNLKELEFLLENKPITITCNEKDYTWNGTRTYGHASDSNDVTMANSKIKHPFVSLNPSIPAVSKKPSEDETAEMSATLFHEQFHNLGYSHIDDIEYAYTCEICCIKNNDKPELVAASCKLCAGNYESVSDKNYLTDAILWSKKSHQVFGTVESVLNFQKEFPKDRFGIFAFAAANSSMVRPVGLELGKLLKTKFTDLTEEEKKFLDLSQEENETNFSIVSPSAQILAQLHYEIYYEQKHPSLVLSQLEAQEKTFKQMLEGREHAKGNDKETYDNVVTELTEQLRDIQLANYPNNNSAENKRAGELLNKLKLED